MNSMEYSRPVSHLNSEAELDDIEWIMRLVEVNPIIQLMLFSKVEYYRCGGDPNESPESIIWSASEKFMACNL